MSKVIKESTVSVRVPGDLRAELELLAEAEERSMSWLMVKAAREYVTRELPKHKSRKS